MTCNAIIDGKLSGFKIKIEDTIIETTLIAHKKFNIYTVLFLPNKIPNKITYKNYKLLLNGLIDYDNKTSKITVKQYLLNGTFISEANHSKNVKKGTFINFKEEDNKIIYSIDYHKKGEEKPIKIEGLSFDEMLKELKKIRSLK